MLLSKLLGRRTEGHILGDPLHAMRKGGEPSAHIDLRGDLVKYRRPRILHELLNPFTRLGVDLDSFPELGITAKWILRVHSPSCRPTTSDITCAVENEREWRNSVSPSTSMQTDISEQAVSHALTNGLFPGGLM